MQVLMKLIKTSNRSEWGSKDEVIENVVEKEKEEKYTKKLCPNAPLFQAKGDISKGEEVYLGLSRIWLSNKHHQV